MARPIKETPILFGDDARRFEARLRQRRRETAEERQRRLHNYHECMAMLEAGKDFKLPNKAMSLDEAYNIISQ